MSPSISGMQKKFAAPLVGAPVWPNMAKSAAGAVGIKFCALNMLMHLLETGDSAVIADKA